jgi:hypothetical protein
MMAMPVWKRSSFTVSIANTGAPATTEVVTRPHFLTMDAHADFMLTRRALESEQTKVRPNAVGWRDATAGL